MMEAAPRLPPARTRHKTASNHVADHVENLARVQEPSHYKQKQPSIVNIKLKTRTITE